MKKRTQQIKYLCSDFISVTLAWLVFNIVRYYEVAKFAGFTTLNDFLLSDRVVLGQVIIPVFWVVLYYYSGYYNKPLEKSRLSELFVTFQSVLFGTLVLFFAILINELPPSFHVYYEQFFILFLLTFLLTYISRLFITQNLTRKVHRRDLALKALILGTGKKAIHVRQLLEEQTKSMGYVVEGYVNTDSICPSVDSFSENVAGNLNDLDVLIKEKKIDSLIVAIDTEDDTPLLDLLYSLYHYNIPIQLPVNYTKLLTGSGGVKLHSIMGAPLINVTDNNFSEGEKNIKKTLDLVVAFFVLILFSPVYIYLLLRIRLDSPGPVFLQQERIGYLGKPFQIYKFRTMVEDAERNGPCLSTESDVRVTRVGRFMRKYRLDELPQFWNVLKGDMSLVGPRPERKYYIDKIVKQAPYFYLLHNVRPGITSWGMVKYGYASTVDQMVERTQYDILYYENMSLLLDLKILIYTIKTVLTGKGI